MKALLVIDIQKSYITKYESAPDVAKYMFWTTHNDIEKTRNGLYSSLGK